MTKANLLKFKSARSSLYDNNVVKIVNVREDKNGVPIIDGMVDGKICLFRASELNDFQ